MKEERLNILLITSDQRHRKAFIHWISLSPLGERARVRGEMAYNPHPNLPVGLH